VEWYSIFKKFISHGVLKVVYEYQNKTFVLKLFKILRSSSRKWAVKIENFEKKIHSTVKILGWSKKQHGAFSSSKLLTDSKNMHVLYFWRAIKKEGVKISKTEYAVFVQYEVEQTY
jgi:hypothetical protein